MFADVTTAKYKPCLSDVVLSTEEPMVVCVRCWYGAKDDCTTWDCLGHSMNVRFTFAKQGADPTWSVEALNGSSNSEDTFGRFVIQNVRVVSPVEVQDKDNALTGCELHFDKQYTTNTKHVVEYAVLFMPGGEVYGRYFVPTNTTSGRTAGTTTAVHSLSSISLA